MLHPDDEPILTLIRLSEYRFSTRITSFALVAQACWPGLAGRRSLEEVIRRAPTVDGLSDLNLTHPDHLGNDPVAVGRRMRDCGLQLSGLAMPWCTNPGYRCGAFTAPDPAVGCGSLDRITRGAGVRRNVPDGARGSIPGHADRLHPSRDPAQRIDTLNAQAFCRLPATGILIIVAVRIDKKTSGKEGEQG